MCTLLVCRDVWPGHPLVVAANRDEFLRRPAEGHRVWRSTPPIVAPRDLEAGGTWIGWSALGVFAGVTNRRSEPRRDGRRSRGELVALALAQRSAVAAAEAIAALDAGAYNPFHLVVCDRESGAIVWGDGESMRRRPLGPGVHVVTEAGEDGSSARARDVLALAGGAMARPPDVEALRPLLTLHRDDPFDGTCNHADAFGYGTRSSTILAVPQAGSARLWSCDERPCTGTFVERSELVLALGR